MNDLADENEDLRERLGLDPKETVDLTDYRNRELSPLFLIALTDALEFVHILSRLPFAINLSSYFILRLTFYVTLWHSGKVVKQEEERAVNQVLQKEVERLEEERLELKQQIRKLAQHGGQR